MTDASNHSALQQLATAAGIAVRWVDAFGAQQDVSEASLRALLKSLDVQADTDADMASSLATLSTSLNAAKLPPMVTGWANEPLLLPRSALTEGTRYQIQLEGGKGNREGQLVGADKGLHLSSTLPPGYHQFEGGGLRTTLAVAPRRCYGVADAMRDAGRPAGELPWGIGAQLYSLRRHLDGGLGDFTALAGLAKAAAAQGASALAVSPVHAMFSAAPERFSPYGPSTRLFFNVLHIDPVSVLGQQAVEQALNELPGREAELVALDAGDLVDWPRVAALRLGLLRHLFGQFRRDAHQAQRQAFDTFCIEGGSDLRDHACYEALDEFFRAQPLAADKPQGDWRQWGAAWHDPRGAAVSAFAAEHAGAVDFHRFLQWQAALGCDAAQRAATAAGMPIGLVADLAVGVDPGGSQAWGLQAAMLQGLTVGAPPDLLAKQGQNWGLAALSPHAMQAQGFAPWLAMLRANLRHSGGIRIDHVLGLVRLWLVPEGKPASQGAYLHYPFDDMLRLVALESHRHQAIVIGEDLGTVPEGFSQTLADAGVLGIRVLWFQREGDAFMAPADWPADAMATTSTHDLATVAGWWAGRDIDWRDRLDLLGPNTDKAAQLQARDIEKNQLVEAMRAVNLKLPADGAAPLTDALAFVGHTPAALVMAPLEDVLGLVEQPNLPGTTAVHPNWQQRLPADARSLLEQADTRRRLSALHAARQSASAAHQIDKKP